MNNAKQGHALKESFVLQEPWRNRLLHNEESAVSQRGLQAVFALCLITLLSLPTFAQTPPNTVPDSGAVIRTETRVVLVDTIVTDKKGMYVRNLTAKDFKVYEDNKQQEIKTFTVQSDPLSPARAQRKYIVLFFDNSTLDFAMQRQARAAAAKFIDSIAAPDRLMSVVNYGGALQISQNFTGDAERLKRVVSGEKFSAVTSNEDASLGNTQISKAAAGFGARDMLLSLRSLAKDMNAIPGRKTLILFTAGFPLNAERMSEATAAIDACNRSNVAIYPIDVRGLMSGAPPVAELITPSSRYSASSLLSRVSFSLSPMPTGMSFFQRGGAAPGGRAPAPAPAPSPGGGGRAPAPAPSPAPTAGGRGPTGPTPQNPGFNRGGAIMPPTLGPQSQARTAIIPKFPETSTTAQNIMYMLADGTGGFVIKNTNDLLSGLQKIGLELDEYYILGYTPPESAEGSCHAVHVKVDKGGTEVRSRTGYCNAKSRDVLANDPVEKTLESHAAGSQPGTVSASLQLPYFYTSTNTARVNVAMEIPAGVMKFEKQKGKFHAQVDILGIAYNPDNSVAARFSDSIKRDFEDKKGVEASQKSPIHYENQFDIGSGKYNFKVVFSAAGDKTAFGKIEMPLNVDTWDSNKFGLSALALSNQVRPQDQIASSLDESLLEDRAPLLASGVQIIPAGSVHFSKAAPPLFYAEVYEPLLLQTGVEQKATVGIQIRLLDRKTGEQKFSTGLMRLDNADIHGPVMAMGERIPIDGVGPGQYTVELQAVDTGGAEIKRTADFDLE